MSLFVVKRFHNSHATPPLFGQSQLRNRNQGCERVFYTVLRTVKQCFPCLLVGHLDLRTCILLVFLRHTATSNWTDWSQLEYSTYSKTHENRQHVFSVCGLSHVARR